jgi:hypothetical protein
LSQLEAAAEGDRAARRRRPNARRCSRRWFFSRAIGSKRVLIAENGLDHVVDQRFDAIDLDLLAEADVVHHVAHDLVGLAMQPPGARRFVLESSRRPAFSGPLLGDLLQAPVEIGIDFRTACRAAQTSAPLRVSM